MSHDDISGRCDNDMSGGVGANEEEWANEGR
jgi:hypothetical protein